ncbi:MAG TPA: hypothetical protein VJA21_30845 [Verrucomicrobiae bacterium]
MKNIEPISETPTRIPYILAAAAIGLLGLYGGATVLSPRRAVQGEVRFEPEATAASAETQATELLATPEAVAPEAVRASDSPISDLQLSFRLDPRLTRSLYMGDRWVSPPTYTRVGEGVAWGCSVEVRVQGVDTQGQALEITPRWTSGDPSLATVSPEDGKEVTISVQRPGQTMIEVAAQGFSKRLALSAVTHFDTLVVNLSQPTIPKLEAARAPANAAPALASAETSYATLRPQSERPRSPDRVRRRHRHLPALVTAETDTGSPQAANSQNSTSQ